MKVGIIGGGQLGRMLALAAHPLGITVYSYDPAADAPAQVCSILTQGAFNDTTAVAEFAASADIVTYEFENVPLESAIEVAKVRPVHPSVDALRISQDRIIEKSCFVELGIPTVKFAAIRSAEDIPTAIKTVGLPAVIKTTRLGYDGKGQRVVTSEAEVLQAVNDFKVRELILEEFIKFDRELSLIAVRSLSGECRCYPLVENIHRQGILRISHAPAAGVDQALQQIAEGYVHKLLRKMEYVGVVALELFQSGNSLKANEMAPRVHNSGHWTIEGAVTSQFENHMRAITGLPLGDCAARGKSCMLNIIGTLPDQQQLYAIPGLHLHLYGKEPRAGRKIGHVTICDDGVGQFEDRIKNARAIIEAQ